MDLKFIMLHEGNSSSERTQYSRKGHPKLEPQNQGDACLRKSGKGGMDGGSYE